MNSPQPPKRKLLEHVRDTIRLKQYSRTTEKTYTSWLKRFILFHNKRHPATMDTPELEQYLTHLAVQKECRCLTPKPHIQALTSIQQAPISNFWGDTVSLNIITANTLKEDTRCIFARSSPPRKRNQGICSYQKRQDLCRGPVVVEGFGKRRNDYTDITFRIHVE